MPDKLQVISIQSNTRKQSMDKLAGMVVAGMVQLVLYTAAIGLGVIVGLLIA